MTYIINDLKSLEKLIKDKNLRRSLRKIQLDLPISNSENYSREINKYYFACGCEQGAITVFATILIVAIIFVTTDLPILENWWYALIYLLVGAILGKVYGIVHKKIMFQKTVNALKRELLISKSKIDIDKDFINGIIG